MCPLVDEGVGNTGEEPFDGLGQITLITAVLVAVVVLLGIAIIVGLIV